MFDEKLGFSIPDERIANIGFLKHEEFYPLVFGGKEYTVVGGDDVGNLIGLDAKGKVWFLDTENKFAMYASKGFKTFVEQLELYANWEFPDDSASDDVIKANVEKFRREIEKSDMSAALNNNSFWSLIIEQVEDGFL